MCHKKIAIYKLFFFWRYPSYIKHFLHKYTIFQLARIKGIKLGTNISFLGAPIVSIAPGSGISIGNYTVLCSKSEQTALGVNHPVVLRTLREGARLEIGQGVRMSGTTVCAARSVVIGDNTCLGANVTIADTDFHSLDHAVRSSDSDFDSAAVANIAIGADVFVGTGCYILKGVSIGEGAIIGAGSVVTGSIPAFAIAAGNPAKVLGAVPGHSLADDRT